MVPPLAQLCIRFIAALMLSSAAAASLYVCVVWPALGWDFNLTPHAIAESLASASRAWIPSFCAQAGGKTPILGLTPSASPHPTIHPSVSTDRCCFPATAQALNCFKLSAKLIKMWRCLSLDRV